MQCWARDHHSHATVLGSAVWLRPAESCLVFTALLLLLCGGRRCFAYRLPPAWVLDVKLSLTSPAKDTTWARDTVLVAAGLRDFEVASQGSLPWLSHDPKFPLNCNFCPQGGIPSSRKKVTSKDMVAFQCAEDASGKEVGLLLDLREDKPTLNHSQITCQSWAADSDSLSSKPAATTHLPKSLREWLHLCRTPFSFL